MRLKSWNPNLWDWLNGEPTRPDIELVRDEVGPHAAALVETRWNAKVNALRSAREWQAYQNRLQQEMTCRSYYR